VSAITPEIHRRLRTLARFAPAPVPHFASATVVPVGVALFLSARGLARGSRRAWQIAVVLLATSSVLNLLKGLDYEEATIAALVGIALIARRHDFDVRGDPEAGPRVFQRALAFGALVYAYGVVALWINQARTDQPSSLTSALVATSRALVGP